jgi:hypothetical protein
MATKAKKGKKTKAKAEESEGAGKREAARERDAELRPLIVEEREEGKKWSEIAEEHSIQETKALMLFTEATVKPSEKIKPDDLTAELVTELRDEKELAWHVIAARAGYSTVGPIKKLYEEENGEGTATGRVKKAAEDDEEDEKPAKKAKGKKGKKAKKA